MWRKILLDSYIMHLVSRVPTYKRTMSSPRKISPPIFQIFGKLCETTTSSLHFCLKERSNETSHESITWTFEPFFLQAVRSKTSSLASRDDRMSKPLLLLLSKCTCYGYKFGVFDCLPFDEKLESSEKLTCCVCQHATFGSKTITIIGWHNTDMQRLFDSSLLGKHITSPFEF